MLCGVGVLIGGDTLNSQTTSRVNVGIPTDRGLVSPCVVMACHGSLNENLYTWFVKHPY